MIEKAMPAQAGLAREEKENHKRIKNHIMSRYDYTSGMWLPGKIIGYFSKKIMCV